MKTKNYIVPSTTVFRKVGEELVVVQLETSRFYFFSPETEKFLEDFRAPRDLDSYCAATKADPAYLKEFCRELAERKLISETEVPAEPVTQEGGYLAPLFLREAEWTLDQLSFTCIP